MDLVALLEEYIVPICAIAGFGLGVANLFLNLRDRRINLKVVPKRAMSFGEPDGVSIEVINRSKFPVRVAEIGLTLDGRNIKNGRGLFTMGNAEFPKRLERGESCEIAVSTLRFMDMWGKLGWAYAQTSCGSIAYGNSPALNQMREELGSGAPPQTVALRGHHLAPGQVARTANRM